MQLRTFSRLSAITTLFACHFVAWADTFTVTGHNAVGESAPTAPVTGVLP